MLIRSTTSLCPDEYVELDRYRDIDMVCLDQSER